MASFYCGKGKKFTRLCYKSPEALESQVAMFRLLFIKKSFLKLFTMRTILKEHSIIAINKCYLRNNNKPTMKIAAVGHSLVVTDPTKLQKCSNTLIPKVNKHCPEKTNNPNNLCHEKLEPIKSYNKWKKYIILKITFPLA